MIIIFISIIGLIYNRAIIYIVRYIVTPIDIIISIPIDI